MVRRYLTLGAMLLVMASLMVGIVGTASAQDPVHEADGTWHKSDDGTVRLNVTWKGVVNVRWKNWLADEGCVPCDAVPDSEIDCVADGDEPDAPVAVDRWDVTASGSDGSEETKNPKHRSAHFSGLSFEGEYRVTVEAFAADDSSLGTKEVTIRPRHISPPEPVPGLTLDVGDDNLNVAASWTAPAAGGKPKRYVIIITNLETGRVIGQWVNVTTRGKKQVLPTEAVFDGLWPGDSYRVSVQALTYDSRASSREAPSFPVTDGEGKETGVEAVAITEGWQGSAWTSDTITLSSGDDPDYAKVEPALVWTPVLAGDDAPPYVIGEPTAYIIRSYAPGGYSRFDAPGRCPDYMDHHPFFRDAGVSKAVRDAWFQQKHRLVPAQEALAKAKAENSSQAIIDRRQAEVEAAQAIPDGMVAKLKGECARAYSAVETLTDADNRWYQAAGRLEWK